MSPASPGPRPAVSPFAVSNVRVSTSGWAGVAQAMRRTMVEVAPREQQQRKSERRGRPRPAQRHRPGRTSGAGIARRSAAAVVIPSRPMYRCSRRRWRDRRLRCRAAPGRRRCHAPRRCRRSRSRTDTRGWSRRASPRSWRRRRARGGRRATGTACAEMQRAPRQDDPSVFDDVVVGEVDRGGLVRARDLGAEQQRPLGAQPQLPAREETGVGAIEALFAGARRVDVAQRIEEQERVALLQHPMGDVRVRAGDDGERVGVDLLFNGSPPGRKGSGVFSLFTEKRLPTPF